MSFELTIEERDRLMDRLSEGQRHFIHHALVRGRRTLFARQLAKIKCQFIPDDAELEELESYIEEWDYIGFTDSGEVSPHTKCECGRSLRYQHKVLHIPSNTIRYFGIEHLQMHTGIDAKTISSIMKGFDVLDYEMNEVLCKFRDGWQLSQHLFLPLPSELDIPKDIQDQLDAQLPLLDRQLQRLRSRLRELEKAHRLQPVYRIPLSEPAIEPVEQEEQVLFLFEEFDMVSTDSSKIESPAGSGSFDAIFAPEHSTKQAGNDLFSLPAAAKRVIDQALPQGRISCLAVSEFLIENKLVPDWRMSTGKPNIYIAVAAYLDELTIEGLCTLVDASIEDRIYTQK